MLLAAGKDFFYLVLIVTSDIYRVRFFLNLAGQWII